MLKLVRVGRLIQLGCKQGYPKDNAHLNPSFNSIVTQFRTKYNQKSSNNQNVSIIPGIHTDSRSIIVILSSAPPLTTSFQFQDSDSDEDDDDLLGSDKSLMRTSVNSLRMDLIIKAGLGLARK